MNRKLTFCVSALALAFAAAPAVPADLASIPWNGANSSMLNSAQKMDVLAMFNEQRAKSRAYLPPLTAAEIGQFVFTDLAGHGRYQLVTTSSYACTSFIAINDKDAAGRVRTVQTIAGWADLKTGIKDLNGDGKDELIIDTPMVEYDCASVITWPAVYRLVNGKYVEASRDFPAYYDNEVLPQLETKIANYRPKPTLITENPGAGLTLERDKILRVLGRNPNAGLNQAYDWMNSSDPRLAFDAAETFKDISGHDAEARAAGEAYRRAICERHPTMAMCQSNAAQLSAKHP